MKIQITKIIALIISLVVLFFTTSKSCKKEKSIKTTKNASVSIKDTGVRYSVNGINVLRKEQVVADKNTVDILFKNKVDSLLKIVGAQAKQLKEFSKIDLSASGIIKSTAKADTVIIHDTLSNIIYTASFNDSLIDATAIFNPDSLTMKLFYNLNLSLNYVVTSKRKRRLFIWKKKKTYVDVFSKQKNVKIKSFESVKIKPE